MTSVLSQLFGAANATQLPQSDWRGHVQHPLAEWDGEGDGGRGGGGKGDGAEATSSTEMSVGMMDSITTLS